MLTAAVRKVRGKVKRSLVRHGVFGTLVHSVRLTVRGVRALDPRRRRSAAEWERFLAEFDQSHNIDTAGTFDVASLEVVGKNRDQAQLYKGTHPLIFREMIGSLPIAHEEYHFIDYGSGKGRAMLLASEWPFKAIVGIEFSPELHRIAEANIQSYRNPAQQCREIRSECKDVVEFEPPREPTVFFFFNPFGETILATVLETIRRSYEESPRDLWFCFEFPQAHRPLEEAPFVESVAATETYRIYRTRWQNPS